jgi:hypothetical protein
MLFHPIAKAERVRLDDGRVLLTLVDGTQDMVVDVQPTAPLGPFMDAFCV